MPLGCIGSGIIGTTAIGEGACTLEGTFTRSLGAIPPAPWTTQNTLPQAKVAQAN